MPLDPLVRDRFHVLDALPANPFDPEFARVMDAFEAAPEPWTAPAVTVDECVVAGPHGDVPVRVYGSADRGTGVLVWIHGGAFVAGGLDMNESHVVAAEVAHRAGVCVVTVGYTLARNGVAYPVPNDDCYAVWQWCRSVFAPHAAVTALGGASAGATLAVSSALRDVRAGNPPADLLLLAYPFLHHPLPVPGQRLAREFEREMHPALRMGPEFLEFVVRNYAGSTEHVPADAIPGGGDLRGLPRVEVVVAEYDDLRPSGESFVAEVEAQGVQARCWIARGMPHGFLNRTPWWGEVSRTLEGFVSALQQEVSGVRMRNRHGVVEEDSSYGAIKTPVAHLA